MDLNKFMRTIYGKKLYTQTALMILLAFCSASALFIVTYYLGLIIDAVSIGYSETVHYFFAILFSLLASTISSALLAFWGGKMKAEFSYRLQVMIGEKICSAQFREIEQINDGELLSIAAKDIEGLKNWLSTILKIGCLPAQLGLTIFFLAHLNWKFALCTIGLIPLIAIPEMMIAKRLGVYHANEKKTYGSILSFFTGTIGLLLVIKSFCLEELFGEKNKAGLKLYKKARMKRILREQMVDNYGRAFGHFTNILLLVLGAYFILEGEMSLGMLTSVILLANFVGEGIKILNEVPVSLQGARASTAHIQKLFMMQNESEMNENLQHVSEQKLLPVYDVRSLSFMYGSRVILHDISFCIYRGEKIAVAGTSGCGKTTLFKLLGGLYMPEKGQIYFQGKDIAEMSPEYIREKITAVAQETFLFHGTFKDNIKMTDKDCREETVAAAGKNALIDDFIQSFEKGYDTVINTAVQSISNGQMQRINLARAFFKHGNVLLLDEPVSALDQDTAKMVLDNLFFEYRDSTILMILHNMQEIKRFDKVLVLDGKAVAGFGTHEELMELCAVYRRLYNSKMVNDQEREV